MKKDTESKVISFPSAKSSAYNADHEREANVIGSKIDEARRKAGLSMNEFSDLLKIYGVTMSPNGVSKWVRGKALPNAYQLVAICHALDMELDLSYFCADYTPLLNDLGQQKVRAYRDDLIASGKYKPQPKIVNVLKYADYAVSNLSVSAGTGAFLDEGNFEMVSFPENSVPAGAGFLKRDDEQEPDESIRDAYLDSTGCLHMQPILVSYNKDYPPKVITPETELKIIGRVL